MGGGSRSASSGVVGLGLVYGKGDLGKWVGKGEGVQP